jgi:heme o synthase
VIDQKDIAVNVANNDESKYSTLGDYVMLTKLRLSLTVVITSLLGFFIAAKGNYTVYHLLLLFVGGFLVTAAANTLNQVLEKDFDKLMSRTQDRPLAAGRMKISDAVLFAGICCVLGVSMLAMFNPLTAVLGMLSFLLYAFVYTPLKRYSPMAVAVGAVPGALPVLIGCTAAEGTLTALSMCLFLIQFFWQFPHFWSIGYLGFDDYRKAGYELIPHNEGEIERSISFNGFIYICCIIPLIIALYYLSYVNMIGLSVMLIVTVLFGYFGLDFNNKFDRSSALKLMFFSFFYMPIILITCLIS